MERTSCLYHNEDVLVVALDAVEHHSVALVHLGLAGVKGQHLLGLYYDVSA